MPVELHCTCNDCNKVIFSNVKDIEGMVKILVNRDMCFCSTCLLKKAKQISFISGVDGDVGLSSIILSGALDEHEPNNG